MSYHCEKCGCLEEGVAVWSWVWEKGGSEWCWRKITAVELGRLFDAGALAMMEGNGQGVVNDDEARD